MAEYIEREMALEVVEMYRWGKHLDKNTSLNATRDGITNIPAADVAPVVHGRWEHLEQGWIDLWRCSACGDEWTFEYDPTDSETKVNYCPNCGAHMKDGE